MSKYNLKTGDILLFDYEGGGSMGIFSWLIKKATKSNITHVGMVLKDPVFINPTLKGYYVWESGWEGTPDPQDGKIKLGVQIAPLSQLLDSYKNTGHVVVRRVTCSPNLFSDVTPMKVIKFMLGDVPIGHFTHSYGFHTRDGRAMREFFSVKYNEHEQTVNKPN